MIKLLVLFGSAFFHADAPADSLGKEVIDGKIFVIHRVELKETLYGIAKRYGTTVEAVLEKNPQADAGLEVGAILKVPFVQASRKPNGGVIHVVAEKETLFSIARSYNLSVDELKSLNNLSGNTLSVGQELTIRKKTVASIPTVAEPIKELKLSGTHTVAAKETLFGIAKKYNVSLEQLKAWNNLEGNELKLGQILIVSEANSNQQVISEKNITTEINPVVKTAEPEIKQTTPSVEETVKTQPIQLSEGYKDGKEVKDTGLAELIDGTQSNRKYLALHRSAPVGTILKVKNLMNDREVFVRVIGQLPDIAANDKIVLKISRSAYERLGAIDPRFLVEVTWFK
jgi:LysM repeat protein